jgi:probable phosphomutase (TIGR03848 family)
MTTVLLVRHGRSTANTSGILAGRTPGVQLDEVGLKQATEAGERIAPLRLRALVSSPLERCQQTAQALLAPRTDGLEISTEEGLVECGYGDWTGKPLKELSKDKLWKQVQQQPSSVRFPNGESMTEMSARAIGSIRDWDDRLTREYGDDAVWAAVSHADVIKAIMADALAMHLDSFQRILIDPASVSIVRYTSTRPYVIKVNSTSADLAALFPPAAKKTRSRRAKAPVDAPVGGGLGAADAVD